MIEGTAAHRRQLVRQAVIDALSNGLGQQYPDCPVIDGRAFLEAVDDWVTVYFQEGERERLHRHAETAVDLVVRVNTAREASVANRRLEAIAGAVEQVMQQASLPGVFDCYFAAFSYDEIPDKDVSAHALVYQLRYND